MVENVLPELIIDPAWGNAVADALNGHETGANSNGQWARSHSGLLVCWDRRSVTDQAISSAYGSLWIGARSIAFPAPFAAPPAVTVGEAKYATGASWGGTDSASETFFTARFYDTASRAAGAAFAYSWIAVGISA